MTKMDFRWGEKGKGKIDCTFMVSAMLFKTLGKASKLLKPFSFLELLEVVSFVDIGARSTPITKTYKFSIVVVRI